MVVDSTSAVEAMAGGRRCEGAMRWRGREAQAEIGTSEVDGIPSFLNGRRRSGYE